MLGGGHIKLKGGVSRTLSIFLTLNISKTMQTMKNPKTSEILILFLLNFPKKIIRKNVGEKISIFFKCKEFFFIYPAVP